MATEITPEQRQAIHATGGPVELVDPETQEHFVLLRAETYQRLHHLFDDGPLTAEQRRDLLAQAGKRAGWDEPEMDVYNELDPRRP